MTRIVCLVLALLFFSGAHALGSICDNAPCEDAIAVRAGENFSIELESNSGSTGFEWWSQFDASYLDLEASSEAAGSKSSGMVGVPGKKVMVFKARQAGSTDIVMLLLQPWENGSIAQRKIFPVNIS